jgi:hypothetical protein
MQNVHILHFPPSTSTDVTLCDTGGDLIPKERVELALKANNWDALRAYDELSTENSRKLLPSKKNRSRLSFYAQAQCLLCCCQGFCVMRLVDVNA